MKLSYEDHQSISVLTLSGELTVDQSETFRRAVLDRFATGVRDVVLDLQHLSHVDSAGLESLLWLQDEVGDRSGQLRLVRPDETIRTVLHVTRLSRRFDTHESIESAAKSLRMKS
jgi:anti-sigma B factor antagonist